MRSGLWFLLTGAMAAMVHLAVFSTTRKLAPTMAPELANAAGFSLAFFVSFWGHRRLSFRGTSISGRQSLFRFALTAICGFATNEATFSLLLRQLEWSSWLALLCGLTAAAGQTFFLGRYWAFRR